MRTVKLTKQIKLEVGEHTPSTTVIVTLKGREYILAWIDHNSRDLNLDAVKDWSIKLVASLDFASPNYIPREITSNAFQSKAA